MKAFASNTIFALLGCILLLNGCVTSRNAGELKVRTDFAGGSAEVEQIDQVSRTIRLVPTHHPDRGWDAWWYFRVDGIRPGETITLDVGKGIWATPTRAVFSLDNKTWQQTAPGTRAKDRITFQQTIDASSVWFAWGQPFRAAEAREVIQRAVRKSRHATAFTLARSREGRAVPALRIREPGVADSQRFGIWIQARQHAWESGSSWIASGLVDWLVSNDPRATMLRRNADITIVPIMDLDNVERGAGGKTQKPHDHNRDWSDEPHWPEVAAAMAKIKAMDATGRFHVFIDLHNPGPNSRAPFFFFLPKEELAPNVYAVHREFMGAVQSEMKGPLAFKGDVQNSGEKYDADWKKISSNWVRANTRDHVVSLCLETPWNLPESTKEGYQQVGRELGLAIELFLRDKAE